MLDHGGLPIADYARSKAFYEKALAPVDYALDYYGAFVRDPDGHNIEAVCHAPA